MHVWNMIVKRDGAVDSDAKKLDFSDVVWLRLLREKKGVSLMCSLILPSSLNSLNPT